MLKIEQELQKYEEEGRESFFTKYSLLKKRLLSIEYTHTMSGFPGGNDHGPGHIKRVLEHLDDLLAPVPLKILSPYELFLAMMAVLYHDVGILRGRKDHPEASGALLLLESNDYVFDLSDRERIDAAVRSHSSNTDIEHKCQRFPKKYKVLGHVVRMRTVAALVRLADELDEDYSRADAALEAKLKLSEESLFFWHFCQRVSGVSAEPHRREIDINLEFRQGDAERTYTVNGAQVNFVRATLEKVLKINKERSICTRFFPEQIQYDALRLTLVPFAGQSAWAVPIEIIVNDGATLEQLMGQLPSPLKPSTTVPVVQNEPQPVAVEMTAEDAVRSPLAGWTLVDAEFLRRFETTLTSEQLCRYFDGRVPNWRDAVSPQIPQRRRVGEIRDALVKATSAGAVPQIYLLLGAGGEGKSTILRQVAASLARNDASVYRVLWRTVTGQLDAESLSKLEVDGSRWLMVSDDADTIVDGIARFTLAAHEACRTDIDLLLCARDVDWNAADGPQRTWSHFGLVADTIVGLEPEDARMIIGAWASAGSRGLGRLADRKEKERVPLLLAAAKKEASREAGSFLGAMLRTRYGQTPRDHVKLMMERLARYRVSNGQTLLDLFLHIAAAHAINLPLASDVLSVAVKIDVDRLNAEVVLPLGEEAAAEMHGRFVLVRHRAIADAAVALAGTFRKDLAAIYSSLTRATVTLKLKGVFVPDYDRYLFSSKVFVAEFHKRAIRGKAEEGVLLDLAPDELGRIARSVARATVDADPSMLRHFVGLCHTLRELGSADASIAVARSVIKSMEGMKDLDMALRGFYYEWSVAEGIVGNNWGSIWLACLSLSDDLGQHLGDESAKMSLAGIGRDLLSLLRTKDKAVCANALMAVSQLGAPLAHDRVTLGYFAKYQKVAEGAAATTADVATSLKAMPQLVAFAQKRCPDIMNLRSSFKATNLRFTELKKLVSFPH